MKKVLFLLFLFSLDLNSQTNTFLHWVKAVIGDTISSSAIAIDKSGNVITTGSFYNADFDPGPGTYSMSSNGGSNGDANAYILKLNSAGNFLWARNIGGQSPITGFVDAEGIVTDAVGNIYTIGSFGGIVDFDPGPGTYTLSSSGSFGYHYLLKLDPSGIFVWAQNIGVNGSIASDLSGNIYVAGSFAGIVDFDPGPGIFNLTSNGPSDISVTKFDASGNFLYVKRTGGSGTDVVNSIRLDSLNNIYTTGSFEGTVDFDPGLATVNFTSAGLSDIFISKLDAAGNHIWSKTFGANGQDSGVYLTTDPTNNIYAGGTFQGTVDVDPGPGVAILNSINGNNYILKLDPSGNYVWSKNLKSTLNQIVIAASNLVYVTGSFTGTVDFDPGPSVFNLTSIGIFSSGDACISMFDVAGNFNSAGQIPYTFPEAFTADHVGNFYGTGIYFGNPDFDTGPGVFMLPLHNGMDVFIVKMNTAPVGIKENSNSQEIIFSPNPTTGLLNIYFSSAGKSEVEVFDCLGKLISVGRFNNGAATIDFSEQPGGIYLVKIKNEENLIVTKKVIRE